MADLPATGLFMVAWSMAPHGIELLLDEVIWR
jgi:hypothetical protein